MRASNRWPNKNTKSTNDEWWQIRVFRVSISKAFLHRNRCIILFFQQYFVCVCVRLPVHKRLVHISINVVVVVVVVCRFDGYPHVPWQPQQFASSNAVSPRKPYDKYAPLRKSVCLADSSSWKASIPSCPRVRIHTYAIYAYGVLVVLHIMYIYRCTDNCANKYRQHERERLSQTSRWTNATAANTRLRIHTSTFISAL